MSSSRGEGPVVFPPLLTTAVAVVAGVFLADGAGRLQAFVLTALGLGLALLAAARPSASGAAAAVLGSAFAVGAASMAAWNHVYWKSSLYQATQASAFDDPILIEGVALTDLVAGDPTRRLLIDVRRVQRSGKATLWTGQLLVRIGGEAALPSIAAGRGVRVWAVVEAPRGFRSPGAVDFAVRARHQGIHATAYCKSAALVRADDALSARPTAAGRARGFVRDRLTRFVRDPAALALVRAMVLGEDAIIDRATQDAFRSAGTYHVLAVSGAQVALIALVLARGLSRLGVRREWAAVAIGLAATSYSALAGGDAAILRAALTATLAVAGSTLDLGSGLPNLTGAAAAGLLVWRPGWAFDPGFQLSFAATLGILAFARPLAARLPHGPFGAHGLVAASIAAQAGVLPVQLCVFHVLPWTAVGANVLAVPLSGIITIGGLALALAPDVGPLCPILGWLLENAAALLSHATLWMGRLPGIELYVPTPPLWAHAVYAGGLLWLVARPRDGFGRALIGAGLLALLAARGPDADGQLHLFVADVGQGDALVLVSPRGRAMVVDTGPGREGGWSAVSSVVAPLLWDRGVRSLDRLVLTHAHPDHVSGIPDLLRRFRIGEVWEGPQENRNPAYEPALRVAAARGLVRRRVAAGLATRWDGVAVRVVWPEAGALSLRGGDNDNSVVLEVAMGESAWLLAGDIERAAEEQLSLRRWRVVKVPHHGSRTSSTLRFVSGIAPGFALVSVGARNRFGHPHRDVLERYRAAGAEVLRTDEQGTIHVSTDGSRLWIETQTAPQSRR